MSRVSSVPSALPDKFPKNLDIASLISCNAAMNTRELQHSLRSIIEQLSLIVESLAAKSETPEMLEAVKRNNQGLCCFCGEPHGEGVIYRGDHEKCYKRVSRTIASKEITDEQAVRRGWWLPADKGGRKVDASDPISKYKQEKSPTPKSRKKRS